MKLTPKKSLGQHFLNSKHVLAQIIEAAKLQKGERVLEIGPGTGVLTQALLETGAKVTAIEKDRMAVQFLRIKHENVPDFNLIEGDILTLDVNSIFQGPYSIIANIPYYITGAILEKFLENEPRPTKMVLLVQKEVADRIVARNGKESILSVSVKAFGTPKIIAKVPPGAFTPPPTVDSAILAIESISGNAFKENNVDISLFFNIVRVGFAHKRKYLIRNLEAVIGPDQLNSIWKHLSLDEKVRAEDLKVKTWIDISSLAKDGQIP